MRKEVVINTTWENLGNRSAARLLGLDLRYLLRLMKSLGIEWAMQLASQKKIYIRCHLL